jgi:nucleotide-binding universal stress UspA family protein
VRRIIVGFDGSDSARRALERVAMFARNGDAVTVVSAIPLRVSSMGAVPPGSADVQEHERELHEAAAILAARGIVARRVTEWGNPADVIIDEANEIDADLVVVGSSGKNVVERHVLGSVSSDLVHRAPCDVLVVR